MNISIRLFMTMACAAGLMAAAVTAGEARGGSGAGGHSAIKHNLQNGGSTGGANNTGAAPRPTSVGQPKPPVVRDHGDKPTTTGSGRPVCNGGGHCTGNITDHRTNSGSYYPPHWRPSGNGPANTLPPH